MKIIKIAGKLVPCVWTLDPETGEITVLVKAKNGNKSCKNARSLLPDDGTVTKEQVVSDGAYNDDGTGDGSDGGGGGGVGVKEPSFITRAPVEQVKTGPTQTKSKA